MSERITERQLWSQRRESESLRQEQAVALPGGGAQTPTSHTAALIIF